MLSVIDQWLKDNNTYWNQKFNGLNVVMLSDFYQVPSIQDCYILKSFNDNNNVVASNLWKNNVKCYELTTIMWQIDTQFIKFKINYVHACKLWKAFNITIVIVVDKYQMH
jgi:hypothetical protein